ncbi:hypothetical protein B0S90_2321 [Caldicellulosiruptor bescii]|uniref:Uncharacterized protein n=4 Tax=Caldicellulosiruptor bescii TaxID=31899 RepID=B9ML96_CALBD|nr:hypothetical protein Athe_1999 [Caldicellulosiruptor bescii DSM 6725]PBC89101.1 hypothetical protein B0S87_2169 [Caldicellulosiruptor bescii]PBC91417.1 hypothetical protein B0S89_1823 [Caldicellulosiruptor bescii]PBD03172.1 hypothetical protein B0S85_0746 [Caldicellulosiruptor bescii]PBD07215.1 hypothetical protein B0S90_2321 [Caldicellulosiruptor bescii]
MDVAGSMNDGSFVMMGKYAVAKVAVAIAVAQGNGCDLAMQSDTLPKFAVETRSSNEQ